MPVDLIGALIAGVAAGGLVWLVFRTIRRPLPRFLIPMVVGTAMLAYAIWNEYSWASRTIDAFPAGFEVIDRIPERSPWRPWTYLVPRVSRLIVLDRAEMRRNERHPGYVLVELVLFERLIPAKRVNLMVDCEHARLSDVTGGGLAPDALPPESAWSPLRRDGTLFKASCAPASG